MLIGILGDIHGNIDALNATLDYFDRLSVKRVFCCGDVVGYGGAPGACIDTLRERNIPCACGNHDSYVAFPKQYNPKYVRAEANKVITWTRSVLTQEQLAWLTSLPMYVETEDFIVMHASCQPFPPWIYVTGNKACMMHLLFQQQRICFNGHSHIPLLATHRPGHKIAMEYLHNTRISKQGRTMVGVGAVGQPRDEDPRACSVLYNDETDDLTILRVKYDIAAAQRRILENGLPPMLATRLSSGT